MSMKVQNCRRIIEDLMKYAVVESDYSAINILGKLLRLIEEGKIDSETLSLIQKDIEGLRQIYRSEKRLDLEKLSLIQTFLETRFPNKTNDKKKQVSSSDSGKRTNRLAGSPKLRANTRHKDYQYDQYDYDGFSSDYDSDSNLDLDSLYWLPEDGEGYSKSDDEPEKVAKPKKKTQKIGGLFKRKYSVTFGVEIPKGIYDECRFLTNFYIDAVDSQRTEASLGPDYWIQRGDIKDIHAGLYIVKVTSPDLENLHEEKEIVWDKKTKKINCQFPITLPPGYSKDDVLLKFVLLDEQFDVIVTEIQCLVKIVDNHIKSYSTKQQNPVHGFISYSRLDADIAYLIRLGLGLANEETFIDFINIPNAENWDEIIKQAIDDCDVFYLIWSKNAAKSYFVSKEMKLASDHFGESYIGRIIPIRIDDTTKLLDDFPNTQISSSFFEKYYSAKLLKEEAERIQRETNSKTNDFRKSKNKPLFEPAN